MENFNEPGYEETVYTVPGNAPVQPRDFLNNFDPNLVCHPGVTPEKYVPGQTPYLVSRENGMILTDPIINRFIAVYDYEYSLPWFVSRGYLRKNPRVNGDYKFLFDPSIDPFKSSEQSKILNPYNLYLSALFRECVRNLDQVPRGNVLFMRIIYCVFSPK